MDDAHDQPDLELYLLRHAHAGNAAEWDGPDDTRPLSPKGKRQADRLGTFLADRRFDLDAIITSPKKRAMDTARIVGDALGVGVLTDDRLGGPLDLDVLDSICGGAGPRVMLVGHDPDFSEVAAMLSGAGYMPMKKGALARIDVSLPFEPGGGTLRWLLPPDALATDTR
jgi:phosphohistidine phosphatase